MSRNEQTEKVFVKFLRAEIVDMDTQLSDLSEQGKPAVSTRKLEFFHWYFLAAYYGLVVPIKIKKREGNQLWEITSCKFQKLLCVLIFRPLLSLELMTYLALKGREFYANKDPRPKDYLEFANSILHVAYLLKFSWILVTHKDKLEKLFNDVNAFSLFHIKEPCAPQSSGVSKRTTWLLSAYMLFMFVFSFVYYVIRKICYDSTIQTTIANGRKRFFLEDLQNNISETHINGTRDMYDIYLNVNILVGFAELVLMLSRLWYIIFVITFFSGVLPLTFWYASKRFQRYLSGIDTFAESPTLNKSFNSSQADMIVAKYDELKNLLESLNSVWSTATVVYVICKSYEVVVSINPRVGNRDMVHLLSYVGFTFLFVVSLVLLAEGCRMNASIKLWLCKKNTREQIFVERKSELEYLKMDFEFTPVGIGVVGVCDISYGFLTQLLVFCVTVFLISF
ncbi:unnamed protein product [Orchesella dallaii]|uniref:Gustatory receptor n=1 Tax=Orchesella dallaii TaxID=48710 RepID=A0ABP1RTI2_9HEXA